MIRIITERIISGDVKYVEGFCLSTDTKPTGGLLCTGSKLTESDTGDVYLYSEKDTPEWSKVAAGWVDPNP